MSRSELLTALGFNFCMSASMCTDWNCLVTVPTGVEIANVNVVLLDPGRSALFWGGPAWGRFLCPPLEVFVCCNAPMSTLPRVNFFFPNLIVIPEPLRGIYTDSILSTSVSLQTQGSFFRPSPALSRWKDVTPALVRDPDWKGALNIFRISVSAQPEEEVMSEWQSLGWRTSSDRGDGR